MSWYCDFCGGSETSCTCNATSNAIKIEETKAKIEILMKGQVK